MDLATHAVTSLALARGIFPRRSWPFLAGIVLAGTLADADLLTLLFGPGAYLAGRHTFTHSFVGTVVVIGIAVLLVRLLPSGSGSPPKAAATHATGFTSLLLATSLAAIVHVLMDLATSSGVALLWPFRTTRFAWDCLPFLDPWILVFVVVGIALPELLALVGSEIGAREKSPRGRNGALLALALVVFYVGGRTVLHSSAATQLDAHTYRGESARRLAAFPDSLSLLNWHGAVETASQLCTTEVPVAGTTRFDAEAAACLHKPEDSPALRTAQETAVSKKFLQEARFPRASVSGTQSGTEVVLRDLRDTAQNDIFYALAARILLDSHGQVTSEEIVWAGSVKLR